MGDNMLGEDSAVDEDSDMDNDDNNVELITERRNEKDEFAVIHKYMLISYFKVIKADENKIVDVCNNCFLLCFINSLLLFS